MSNPWTDRFAHIQKCLECRFPEEFKHVIEEYSLKWAAPEVPTWKWAVMALGKLIHQKVGNDPEFIKAFTEPL